MKAELKSATYFALKRALTDSNVYDHWQWFLRMQSRPANELSVLQDTLLGSLCRSAVHGVPAYRARFDAAGLDSNAARIDRDAFSRLPLTTRQDLVDGGEDFLNETAARSELEVVSTGGSTGSPLRVLRDAHARDWWLASTFLFNSWLGLRVGVPYLFLWGAPEELERGKIWPKRLNLGFLHGRRTLESSTMSADKERAHLNEINRQTDCDYLIGYANEICNLATRSLDGGPRLNRPFKAVVTTAEDLTPSMRATIERAFGGRVINRYGSRETGDLASECTYQRGLHVNPLFAYVEAADDAGRPLPPGEEGQLIITSLHNRAMPLIRYAIGDRGVLRAPEPCECGRTWPSIVALTGRTSDLVYLPDGVRLRAAALDAILETLPRLRRYQAYQEAEQRLLIKLKCAEPNYLETHRAALDEVARKLRQYCNAPLSIMFEQTEDAFHKTPAGKELKIVRSPAFEAALRSVNPHERGRDGSP